MAIAPEPKPGQALERRGTLLEKLGAKYLPNTPKAEVLAILNQTAFKTKDGPPTNAQVAALLVVADQYGLNPWTREIFAFPDKQNGIVPVVGIDGWNRIANEHPQYAGEVLEIAPRDEWEKMDEDAKLAPPWMKVTIYRKDRDYPYEHVEYLDECYRPAFEGKGRNGGTYKIAGPWQTHTKRMLEHKTRTQGRRGAFGFAGIYDEDEAERIVAGEYIEGTAEEVLEGIGIGAAHALFDLAERKGFTVDDVTGNAGALGHEGAMEDCPPAIAQKIAAALEALPDAEPAGEAPDEPAAEAPGGAGAPSAEEPPADDATGYWPSDDAPPADDGALFEPEPEPAPAKPPRPKSATEAALELQAKAAERAKTKRPTPAQQTMLDAKASELTRLVGADVTRRVLNEAAGVGDVDQVTGEWAAATIKELQEAIQRARNAGATEGTSA